MAEPIENAYFNWLCAKVLDRHSQNHFDLLTILHQTEFVWVVFADRHRIADGLELRKQFITFSKTGNDELWDKLPCSMLEMLIAFSNRASFQTDRPAREWFWEFLTNLHLNEFTRVSNRDIPVIEDALHMCIYRLYDEMGWGGLCPLTVTTRDQREVEIWYQFCEYLEDRGLV